MNKLDQNNNRAAVRGLAFRSVKASGLSGLLAVFTLAFTAAIATGLLVSGLGVRTAQLRLLARAQHVVYMDLTSDQLQRLSARPEFSSVSAYKNGQGVQLAGMVVSPCYFEPSSDALETFQLAQGRAPQAQNEAVADAALLQALGQPAQLGQQITIPFLSGGPETFTVVGLTDVGAQGAAASQTRLVLSREYAQTGPQLAGQPWQLMARAAGGDAMGGPALEELLRQIGRQEGVSYQNINLNNAYMDLLAVNAADLMGYLGMGGVLALAGVLVIYSIFTLSVAERVRQFGQLRTIGMTPRQLRRMVRQEGWLLWAVGWPLGSLAGAAAGIVFGAPNGFAWANLAAGVGYSGVLCAAAVKLALAKPAKTAAGASPIQASCYQPAQAPGRGANRPRSLTPTGLAGISARQNSKKTALTMLSLSFGGVLFMGAAIYVTGWQLEPFARQAAFEQAEYVIGFDYNLSSAEAGGTLSLQSQGLLGPQLQSRLLALPGVERVTPLYGVKTGFTLGEASATAEWLTVAQPRDEAILQKRLQEGTGDYDRLENGVYLTMRGQFEELFGFVPQVGDQVTLRYEQNGPQTVTLPLLGIGDKVRYDLPLTGLFLVTGPTAQRLFGPLDTTRYLLVTMQDHAYSAGTDAMMQDFVAGYPQLALDTLTQEVKASEFQFYLFRGMMLGLGGFVVLFSLVNLLNTLLSDVMARRQELSMLSAMGMTRRQLRRMLLCQWLAFSAVNLVFTLTLGTLAGWAAYRLMLAAELHYVVFRFPLGLFLAYAALTLLAPAAIITACLRSFERQSLSQRLRAAGR